jgi:hypothetical protein
MASSATPWNLAPAVAFSSATLKSEAEHLMSRLDELLNDRRADEACGASDEDTHALVLSPMCRAVAARIAAKSTALLRLPQAHTRQPKHEEKEAS